MPAKGRALYACSALRCRCISMSTQKSYHHVQAMNGVVLATEKKLRSTLIDESTVKKISVVSPNIGLAYSGMGPDSRLLVRRARKQAQVRYPTLGKLSCTDAPCNCACRFSLCACRGAQSHCCRSE